MDGDPKTWLTEHRRAVVDEALSTQLERVEQRMTAYQGGGHILTDDQAPVEVLGMRAIDGLIQEELTYYKEKFKTEGISGLLG